MPEILEVERYRRLAETTVGRRITLVVAPDDWFCRPHTGGELVGVLEGRRILRARRIGKLLVFDLSGGDRLGLRFGMTGRLVVDGASAIDRLEYSSGRDDPAWDRITLQFGHAGLLRVNDPRRLGGAVLDPDESLLGPDAFTVTSGELMTGIGDSTSPIKACLLDQRRVAGLGNLLADEILWRASLDPARSAGKLTGSEYQRLHRVMLATLAELMERGGSHLGDLMPGRVRGGRCPVDGEELSRRTIGGRTTFSCPLHQH